MSPLSKMAGGVACALLTPERKRFPKFISRAAQSCELAHSKMLREPNRAEFHKALDPVIATSKNKQLVERAKDYKQQP